ncbi:SCO family protein [Streptomyces sp. NA04227]|uniref:SCO family protein n=1 Tax=Streptomyces sp. NA04227 TaxID=2742136 RepID=UPI001590FF11|nr:SCO family protein [Streptomyces sp. NA04227]QKW07889.1 SCO family protein [Streptomyces sp. NA04227]
MRKHTLFAAAALTAAALTLTACGDSEDSAKPVAEVSAESGADAKAATVLDRPFTKPDLVLKDTEGKKYDLRARTKGKPTLVYFGYTHCPDVCAPIMGNISVAMKELGKKLSAEDRENLQVVFVTTDPERDTPKELGAWLKDIDPDFTGLTGDFATIQAGARQLGISIDPPSKDKKGRVVSMHGTQVIAFSPKTDDGYVIYGEDTEIEDWTQDLPKLVKGEAP